MNRAGMRHDASNHNYCKLCKKALPRSYKEEYCPTCKELRLFDSVREYIRSNDVNEYQVAAHFEIPVRIVKQWIKEGRIEYKEQEKKSIISTHCSRCGAPVTFGTLCTQCLRLMNGEKMQGFGKIERKEEDDKMRFLDSKK